VIFIEQFLQSWQHSLKEELLVCECVKAKVRNASIENKNRR